LMCATRMSGSTAVYKSATSVSKPLNALNTIIMAKVPIPTPKAAIPEMMLMTFLLPFENKYLRAMENGTFTP
jgi:hypothetical protein